MPRQLKPPKTRRGRGWDLWCHEMVGRGWSAWWVAQRVGVSETAVLNAVRRVEMGRYEA